MNTTPRAIIIGGSKGIGYATARMLAHRGWDVDSTARGPLWAPPPGGVRWRHREVDLTRELPLPEWQALVEDAPTSVAIVQCLGGTLGVRSDEASPEDWMRVMNLNFHLPVRIHQEFARMRGAPKIETIVYIGSSAAFHGRASTPYACAKAALHRYIVNIGRRHENGATLVCGVAPAAVSGCGNGWDRCSVERPHVWSETAARQPSERFQTPDEVAEVLAWIVLNRPSSLAGTVVSLDANIS
jgi:NAD(P)-dependent dehydrogenase (short-subunit alcohol dehydrogenase family)